jgi:hypothetical protein
MRDCLGYVVALLLTLPTVGRPQGFAADSVHARGTLVGQLLDTTSGLPLRRGLVCRIGGNCADADSIGRFDYPWLSPGEQAFVLRCDSGRRFFPLDLDTLRVRVQPRERLDLRIGVNGARCDQRPFEVSTREFRGHYTAGFEGSSFVPCSDTATGRIWVDLTNRVAEQKGVRWPPRSKGEYYQRLFVRWIGTLRGPYHYGHFGIADYLLSVDSILVVRRPSRRDCGLEHR